jgi:hypothetical protein
MFISVFGLQESGKALSDIPRTMCLGFSLKVFKLVMFELFKLKSKILKTAFMENIYTCNLSHEESEEHRGSFISSQANIVGSSL